VRGEAQRAPERSRNVHSSDGQARGTGALESRSDRLDRVDLDDALDLGLVQARVDVVDDHALIGASGA